MPGAKSSTPQRGGARPAGSGTKDTSGGGGKDPGRARPASAKTPANAAPPAGAQDDDGRRLQPQSSIPTFSIDDHGAAADCANNFMHDPTTTVLRLLSPETVHAPLSNASSLGSSTDSATGAPPSPQPQLQRKPSLMPPLTEEDLRSSNMVGMKDYESVAQVFGEDFASKFCTPLSVAQPSGAAAAASGHHSRQGSHHSANAQHSPLPYDPKEKMLRRRTPDKPLLPFEIRDDSLPRGVPTVKVRRKPHSLDLASPTRQDSVEVEYEDVALALSPVAPNFPGPQSAQHSGDTPDQQRLAQFCFPDLQLFARDSPCGQGDAEEVADLAASNTDIVHFQQALNDWIGKQCRVVGSAFLLVSPETNTTYCQVCGSRLLEEPLVCGDAHFLAAVFERRLHRRDRRGDTHWDEGRRREADPAADEPMVVDLSDGGLPPEVHDALRPLVSLMAEGDAAAPPPASLLSVRAKSGFHAALLVVHSAPERRSEELAAIVPHVSMIATLTGIVENLEEQRRLAHQSQAFLTMTQNVFSSLQDINKLVRNITAEAKTLVNAEICSLFLLDKEHSELVAEVFEVNGAPDEWLTEIRMPLSQGIVGHVATTGQMLNVKDVYNHPFFYPKVDQKTGFTTRNILCFPIKDSAGNLVGVAELCNKIGKSAFTKHDEQIAATFAVYCAISISHCLLYRKLQEAHRRSHMAAELLVQGSTLSIAPEDILRLTVRDIPTPDSFHPNFSHFGFVPRSIGAGDIYVEASLSMFKDLGFIDRYRLRRRTLARFLLMVQKGYRDVPYHNWSHAFSVGHFCYLLLRTSAIRESLADLERFALLVACLCHDIDHRGTTNAFQLQSKTPLAQLYSSEGSVLERHHFAQTITILGMDECNIFEQLTRQQYQTVLDSIREIILATDIAAHLRKVDKIRDMVEVGYNAKSPDHHYLLTCLLMTASDLSDQSKDFRNSKAIAESIYKEFFSQGDLEKQMGNRPIEMMDRERACVPKIQIEFMDTVALPVFDYLSRMLPELQPTYESLLTNRRCWSTLDQLLQEEGLQSGGLDYLKDVELEGKVLQRLSNPRPHAHQQLRPVSASPESEV